MVSFAPGRQGPLRCSRSEHGTSLVLFPLEVVLLGVCPYMTCVQEWGLPLSLALLSSYCVWSGGVGPRHLQKACPPVCPGL